MGRRGKLLAEALASRSPYSDDLLHMLDAHKNTIRLSIFHLKTLLPLPVTES